jgi:hypothetical protein
MGRSFDDAMEEVLEEYSIAEVKCLTRRLTLFVKAPKKKAKCIKLGRYVTALRDQDAPEITINFASAPAVLGDTLCVKSVDDLRRLHSLIGRVLRQWRE